MDVRYINFIITTTKKVKYGTSTHLFSYNLNYLQTKIGEGTLPWAIFGFRIFSNYFSQKFAKIKITV